MDIDELIKALQAVKTLGIAIPKVNTIDSRNPQSDCTIDFTDTLKEKEDVTCNSVLHIEYQNPNSFRALNDNVNSAILNDGINGTVNAETRYLELNGDTDTARVLDYMDEEIMCEKSQTKTFLEAATSGVAVTPLKWTLIRLREVILSWK